MVAQRVSRLRRFSGTSKAGGSSAVSTSSCSPVPAFPARVRLGGSLLAGLRSAPHRNAEIVLGFDRDKANRFAWNLNGSQATVVGQFEGYGLQLEGYGLQPVRKLARNGRGL